MASYLAWQLAYEVLEGFYPRCGCGPIPHFPEDFDFLLGFFTLILAPGLNLILGRVLQVQSRAFLGLQAFLLTVKWRWISRR